MKLKIENGNLITAAAFLPSRSLRGIGTLSAVSHTDSPWYLSIYERFMESLVSPWKRE